METRPMPIDQDQGQLEQPPAGEQNTAGQLARIRPTLVIGLIVLGWLGALALTAVSFARYGVIDSSLPVSTDANEATTYLRSIRDRLAGW